MPDHQGILLNLEIWGQFCILFELPPRHYVYHEAHIGYNISQTGVGPYDPREAIQRRRELLVADVTFCIMSRLENLVTTLLIGYCDYHPVTKSHPK